MRRRFIALAAFAFVVAGCGEEAPPPQADAAKAREALKQVLDAWVKGATAADLKNASPAIVAYDPDWDAGYKLTKYEIDSTDKRAGVDLLVSVTLSLSKTGDNPQKKTVNFAIGIGSQTVVLRQT